ncbi:transposase [Micromonospora sp. U56]|uniref:transposase n=1 Tax=Micromonospora sp. U56 TaxID=2824900 RepID=UPI0035A8D3FE
MADQPGRFRRLGPVGDRRGWQEDGKTLHGSGPAGAQVHLLAAVDHRDGIVLAQSDVDGKTNEITRFAPMLDTLDLAGAIITADALHTPARARPLADRGQEGRLRLRRQAQPAAFVSAGQNPAMGEDPGPGRHPRPRPRPP